MTNEQRIEKIRRRAALIQGDSHSWSTATEVWYGTDVPWLLESLTEWKSFDADRQRNITELEQRVVALETALREIAKGEGRFSTDPLTHASNTIDDIKDKARAALAGTQTGEAQ